jgi:hypothetical protein
MWLVDGSIWDCLLRGAAQAASNVTSLAYQLQVWRLRIQAQVTQDLLHHRPAGDGRDDRELPAAASQAVLYVDVEDSLELLRAADAMQPDLNRLDFELGGACLGGRPCLRR